MTTTLHVGKSRVQTITTSDGSVLPPGAVSVQVNDPVNITVAVDPQTNQVTLTGKSPSTETVVYSAAGYTSTSEIVTTAPIPSLIVTDGPEQ